MKKIIAMLLVVCTLLTLAACGKKPAETPTEAATQAPTTEAPATEAPAETEAPAASAMTHEEYIAAALDSEVTVETYVQAHQSWWDGKVTVYAQSEDGGYFMYEMVCSEEDAAKLVPGTKIRVSGFKTEWSGEVEFASGCTFEILEGSFIAEPLDVTALLGTDELIDHQNEKICLKGLTVAPSKAAESEEEVAFLYNWDGSGKEGENRDLYFNVTDGTNVYTLTVESYLCGEGTEVYTAVTQLQIGDVVDLEGFLYWYNGAQPHVTSLTVVPVMSHEEYVAAELDSEVTVQTYVQAHQSWWDGKVTVYAQSEDGAYFMYEMVCSEEDAAKLVPGTKIRVTGYKTEWSGEVEFASGCTFEILGGCFIAEPLDVTALLGTDELAAHQNEKICLKGLTVAPSKAADSDEEVAFLYNWDGSGKEGENRDLYFNVTDGKNVYTLTVESYLCGEGTDVYTAVTQLKVGDVIDLEGFLYWYNGAQPHVTSVTVVG